MFDSIIGIGFMNIIEFYYGCKVKRDY
jgi:hypothetical protein